MIITTKRRPLHHFFDILLTALGWAVFIIIFGGGILALLRDDARGPDVLFLPSKLVDSIGTVAGYMLLMLIFTVCLIVWAKYNQHRFAGVDRRKPPAPLVAAQLCASFGVSEKQYGDMQIARFLVVAHDNAGEIRSVRAVDEKLKLRANKRASFLKNVTEETATAQSDIVDAALPAAQAKKQSNRWFFLDPKVPVRYSSDYSWAEQRGSYKKQPYGSLIMIWHKRAIPGNF